MCGYRWFKGGPNNEQMSNIDCFWFDIWMWTLTIDVRQKRQIKIQATNYGEKVAWASPEQKEWFVRNKNRPGSACRVRLVWALWVELDSAVWSSPPPPTPPPPPPLPSYMLCPKDTYNLVCLALFYRSLFLERKKYLKNILLYDFYYFFLPLHLFWLHCSKSASLKCTFHFLVT